MYPQKGFVPFDPDRKRTEASIEGEGSPFTAIKGAAQVSVAMTHRPDEQIAQVEAEVARLAGRGYRTLAVERRRGDGPLELIGLIPLYDPPREDSAEVLLQSLQKGGHIVAMTDDGVDDAPALKKADCGFAVDNATDAARAAADVILTAFGLSVINNAIEQTRITFQRMQSYAIFRIAETIRIIVFMTPIGWVPMLLIWGYAVAWFLFNDVVEVLTGRLIRRVGSQSRRETLAAGQEPVFGP
jgi:magnesium-transporting ATPase (P-type)